MAVEPLDHLADDEILRRGVMEAAKLIERFSYLDFCRKVMPGMIIEEVHVLLADALEKVALGLIDRLMVFMPPRTGKTLNVNQLFPAWWMGLMPQSSIMQISYADRLAKRSGRMVRNILRNNVAYGHIFPEVTLARDASAAGAWMTFQGGEYLSAGLTSGIAGTGWNLGLIDDPLSEQDMFSDAAKEMVRDWYGPGFYSRQQATGRSAIIITSTRWTYDDLPGFLLDQAKDDPEADQWHIVKIPAILTKEAADQLNRVMAEHPARALVPPLPPGATIEAGQSFSPRRWPLRKLLRVKRNMPPRSWTALYQQDPSEDMGKIFQRSWWREWKGQLPECELIVQTYDTAFEQGEENSYTARTTWGIFVHSDTGDTADERYCAILLERYQDRPTFPQLRQEAIESYQKWQPDYVLVEKKASGASLIQELRRAEVPVKPWLPDKRLAKASKVARAHAASVVLEQGGIFFPANRQWPEDVIKEMARFPSGEFDDLTDTCVITWLYLRRMFYLHGREEAIDEQQETPEDQVSAVSEEGGREYLYR